jgi:hypothetical protein
VNVVVAIKMKMDLVVVDMTKKILAVVDIVISFGYKFF